MAFLRAGDMTSGRHAKACLERRRMSLGNVRSLDVAVANLVQHKFGVLLHFPTKVCVMRRNDNTGPKLAAPTAGQITCGLCWPLEWRGCGLLSWMGAPEKKAATSTPRLKHIDVDDDDNLLRFYRFRRVQSRIVSPSWYVSSFGEECLLKHFVFSYRVYRMLTCPS